MASPNDIVEVVNIIERPDGSTRVIFDVSPEFVTWFKKWQGLKRWSPKRFQKIMAEALQKYVSHNPAQPIKDPELEDPAPSGDDEVLYKIFGGD
jgi:hypothetical protein